MDKSIGSNFMNTTANLMGGTLSAWTAGYVEGLDYTHGFYRELTPALIDFVALSRGQRTNLGSDLSYCELGCGQGFSANLLAAANSHIQFHANDFNPAHIVGARRLARSAELQNVSFYDHSFADFSREPSLPDGFDIIALHGIYSWVSAEIRRDVIEFIGRKLKPGGLVYISYNTLPGWSAAMPLRRVLVDHARTTTGPIVARIDNALQFADRLLSVDAGYFRHNPAVGRRLEKMMNMSRSYLGHEYFNRDWTPFYFQDIVADLSSAKLSYLGSLNLLNQLDELALTASQKQLLAAEQDPLRREGLRDFILNEQFRNDLFVKGSSSHTFKSAAGTWLATRFALSRQKDRISSAIKGRSGTMELHPQILDPIMSALEKRPMTVRELLSEHSVQSISWEKLTLVLTMLVGTGDIQPCLPEQGEADRVKTCAAFNKAVCTWAEDNENLQFLASPVSGGAVKVNRFEQLFLLALNEGHSRPREWAEFTWRVLAPQGQRLNKDGKILDSAEENLAELRARAEAFERDQLSTLRQHHIVF
ncbi:class I SAM-dependent methyltransferase [Agrobacterium pusense]|uniref:class I SAM-dependent methyltransferase n=1 Tax=Agrobacterium pusense TaxID=648995 RepID=UPI003FD076E2